VRGDDPEAPIESERAAPLGGIGIAEASNVRWPISVSPLGRAATLHTRQWFLPNRRNAVARQVKQAPQMPIYQCITPVGTVPDAVRSQIAKEITRLHVEATNAPPSFVHAIILDVPPECTTPLASRHPHHPHQRHCPRRTLPCGAPESDESHLAVVVPASPDSRDAVGDQSRPRVWQPEAAALGHAGDVDPRQVPSRVELHHLGGEDGA